MELVLVRVDNRLIHGQISTVWVQQVKADRLMVVNDAAATNPMEAAVLKMAKPRTIKKLDILTVDKAAALIKGDHTKDRVMLVSRDPQDIARLVSQGVAVIHVNLGNIHGGPGKVPLDSTVLVNGEELQALKELVAKGVDIYAQVVPSGARSELNQKITSLSVEKKV